MVDVITCKQHNNDMAYADGTGRTPGILNGLGIAAAPDNGTLPASAAGSPKPNSKTPGNDVVNTAPNNQAPMLKNGKAHPQLQARALGVLRAVGQGHLPGVHVPADAPKLDSDVTSEQIRKMGVGIYRPVNKDVAGVFYNPKQVPISTLKVLDAKGKLDDAFPSITKFLGISSKLAGTSSGKGKSGVGTPGGNTDETGAAGPAGASTGTPATGAGQNPGSGGGQQGRNTPSISDLNLTGTPGPTPAAVPVLPRPGMGAGANAALASKRAAAVNGPAPSAMTRPSSSIVSGLWRAPV